MRLSARICLRTRIAKWLEASRCVPGGASSAVERAGWRATGQARRCPCVDILLVRLSLV